MGMQHKFAGDRELSQTDIDAINKIKALGQKVGELQAEIAALPGVDGRATAIAKTELQTGFMWLTRAVAKPESF